MKLNKTETLGIIIPRLSNPFFARLIETFEVQCRNLGYQLIFSCSQNDDQEEAKLIKMMLSRGVDGLFIACNSKKSQKNALKIVNKPIVFIDRNFDVGNINSVITDNFAGGYELAKIMLAKHQKPKQSLSELAVFVGAASLPTIASRLEGIKHYCEEIGFDALNVIHLKGNTAEHGQHGMCDYLQLNGPPKRMITSSLNILEGCLYEAKKQGRQFETTAIFGTFDYHPMLEFLTNELWVVEQNRQELVKVSADIMMQCLSEPSHTSLQQFCSMPSLVGLNVHT